MRVLGIAAKWLFVLCLPVLLLTSSLVIAANSLWLYEDGADKGGVSRALSDAGLKLTDAEIDNVYAEIIRYFNSSEDLVHITVNRNGQSSELFNEPETVHFRDVKNLIWLGYGVVLGTLVYLLAYAGISLFWRRPKYRRQLALVTIWGSGLTLALMLVFGTGMLFGGFGDMLYRFHLLLFTNPYWHAEGYMLLLFPEVLLRDAALFCAGMTAVLAVMLGGRVYSTQKERRCSS